MGESFLDKIRERKGIIIQVVVAVAIAVVVSAVMVWQLATAKGGYDAAILGLEGDIARAGASINTLGTSLNTRMDGVEAIAENATSTVGTISAATTENTGAIETLQTRADSAEARITTVEAHNSPPEGYLTGNFSGNYTLHAKCDTAGNYTANINLVYLTPVIVGNTTQEDALQTFYGSINWTGVVPNYVCTTTYSGNTTTLGISKVSWNIGTFAMTANNETLVNIAPIGLNSTYSPNFAYIEVWPVLK